MHYMLLFFNRMILNSGIQNPTRKVAVLGVWGGKGWEPKNRQHIKSNVQSYKTIHFQRKHRKKHPAKCRSGIRTSPTQCWEATPTPKQFQGSQQPCSLESCKMFFGQSCHFCKSSLQQSHFRFREHIGVFGLQEVVLS